VIGLLVLVQLITGAILFMYYSPSTQTAWESVYFLQYEICAGWLLRAVHHYTAQVLLVVVGLYLLMLILRGAVRAPREFLFWTVLTMGLLLLGLLLTGDLLEWDQNSQSATKVRTGFLPLLPLVGESLQKLAVGGPDFGHLSLTRFLAYHIVMADIFVVLTAALFWFRHRTVRAEGELLPASSQSAYWPNQAIVNMIACCVAMGVVLALALSHGVSGDHRGLALGVPANPIESYDAARPEWAFMGLYGFSNLFPGELKILPIFVIPTVIIILLYLMPFFGRFTAGRIFSVLFVLFLLAGNFYLTYAVYDHDAENEKHQAAIAESRKTADRVIELIQKNGGIPAGGALELVAIAKEPDTAMRVVEILQENDELPPEKMISVEKAMETINNDPVRLFKQHCATCHAYVGGTDQDIPAEEVSAPNLFGYGTKAWIAGWFDPKKISGPDYFGKTAFRRGDMVTFVREFYEEPEEEDLEERQAMILAMYYKSGMSPELNYKDEEVIKQIEMGHGYLVDYCTECHKIGYKGSLGTSTELTDYASREWTKGIIANPAGRRFYGDKNDGMPAYAESNDESKNLLTNRQIEALVDWLRTTPPSSEKKAETAKEKPEPEKAEDKEIN
jgi:ubiquinol-cytochrome c reductase cytochrome b subunit